MNKIELKKGQLKQIISWIFYDFANAPYAAIILTFVFSAFFTQYIALDEVTGTMQWAFTLALTGILTGLGSPILGAVADKIGKKKPWLITFASLVMISVSVLSLFEINSFWRIFTLVIIAMATCCYFFAQVFYNALLLTVAPTSWIGTISGIGWGAGYFGGLCCLVIAWVFFIPKEKEWILIEQGVRSACLLVAGWYLVFSLPAFITIQEEEKKNFSLFSIKSALMQLKRVFKTAQNHPKLSAFLPAYFFYSDGMTTLLNFGGIYAATVLRFSLHDVLLFAVMINLIAGFGSMIFGLIDDRIGPSKLIVYALVVALMSSFIVLTFQNKQVFWIFGLLIGLVIGPLQSASRSLVAHLVPQEQAAELFGLYALIGRLSNFIGPTMITCMTFFFRSKTIGLFVVVVMFFLGLLLMFRFFLTQFKMRWWEVLLLRKI